MLCLKKKKKGWKNVKDPDMYIQGVKNIMYNSKIM